MVVDKQQWPEVQQADQILSFSGNWTTRLLRQDLLNHSFRSFTNHHPVSLDFSALTALDTNGACLIQTFITQLKANDFTYKILNLADEYQKLFDVVTENTSELPTQEEKELDWVAGVGKFTIDYRLQLEQFFSFLGEVGIASWHWLRNPKKIRWISIIHCIDTTGYQAMGIVALLSFLIGIVLCYQMGLQLQDYGAGIYVVDFIGIAMLREFGPLLTAIIVAGRTGASFAAQIGTMKLNQEIDALNTMGLSSTELLILPKMAGLLIALPLLVVLSIMAGVFGGMVMAKMLFGITYLDFLSRFGTVILFKTLVLGMIKTPVFAVLISAIGCFQGLKVSQSAESVGRQTTISVVQAIFMIIVTDAFFSILYSKLGL